MRSDGLYAEYIGNSNVVYSTLRQNDIALAADKTYRNIELNSQSYSRPRRALRLRVSTLMRGARSLTLLERVVLVLVAITSAVHELLAVSRRRVVVEHPYAGTTWSRLRRSAARLA